MDLALYCPVYGYYEREEDKIGRRGDYYTSVSVGSLFGELLAAQFADWLLPSPSCSSSSSASAPRSGIQIIEAGAHKGMLAKDILEYLRDYRPEIFERLEYRILEPSLRRQEWQRRNLLEFEKQVRWSIDLAPSSVQGIVFCNELLDAMPVHRLGWDSKARRWFEWGVDRQNGTFVWTRVPCEAALLADFTARVPTDLSEILPDGFTAEYCFAAEEWWRKAAHALESGWLVGIDYGMEAEEFLAPERSEGTLRAYHRHQVSRDLLANPGEQDLTAHVNFTALHEIGEAAGLKTESLLSQEQFLTRIAARIWEGKAPFQRWSDDQTRQFQTLTHPDHLGRRFRTLISRTANLR
jgi:SAM-dependent MidA family methyltransferase